MYKEYINLSTPKNEELLWRYIDLEKFQDLIQSEELYFCRSDRFEDPWEGRTTRASVDSINQEMYDQAAPAGIASLLRTFKDSFRERIFLSCWHNNKKESAAMWDLYTTRDEGIAIATTVGFIKNCIIDDRDYYIGYAKYVDFDEFHHDGDIYVQASLKRMEFEHEKEVRLIHHDQEPETRSFSYPTASRDQAKKLKVNLACFFEKIIVSPNADQKFVEEVIGILKKYGLGHVDCYKSELYDL